MDFINQHRLIQGFGFGAFGHPFVVTPLIAFNVDDNRRIGGAKLGKKSVGVGFFSVIGIKTRDDIITIDLAFAQAGDKQLPHANRVMTTHRMKTRIPSIEIADDAAATVMAVSGGYPGSYQKHLEIKIGEGLPDDPATLIFHAGTKWLENGKLVTNGGRVIAVTTLAPDIKSAAAKSKAIIDEISFDGKYYRKDIGYEFE